MSRNKKKHQPIKNKVSSVQLAKTSPSLPEDESFSEGERLINLSRQLGGPDASPQQLQAAKAALGACIDAILKGQAEFELGLAQTQHHSGQLSDEEWQVRVDQQLDNLNRINEPTPADDGCRVFITGLNGELIYLGD